LQPAIDRHFRTSPDISELLRTQQRVEEVNGHQRADDKHDERLQVHRILLFHTIAETHIRGRYNEKYDRDRNPKNVLHGKSPRQLHDAARPGQNAIGQSAMDQSAIRSPVRVETFRRGNSTFISINARRCPRGLNFAK
jgi:hypothetical protein